MPWNVLMNWFVSVDDAVLEGFLERYTPTFSEEQREAALVAAFSKNTREMP
jgi:hypothetical protein